MRFLSDEWFESLVALLASTTLSGTAGQVLRLGQVVNDGPGGDCSYTMVLRASEPSSLIRGSTAEADVTLIEDYATAGAIIGGTPPSDLLATGQIKVRGNTEALIAAQDLLQELAPLLTDFYAATAL